MSKDWRLAHLETQPYLRGVAFVRKQYRKPGPRWNHDHCVACWAKLVETGVSSPDVIHEGYATTSEYARGENYDWVCESCFELFRSAMEWRDETTSTQAGV